MKTGGRRGERERVVSDIKTFHEEREKGTRKVNCDLQQQGPKESKGNFSFSEIGERGLGA